MRETTRFLCLCALFMILLSPSNAIRLFRRPLGPASTPGSRFTLMSEWNYAKGGSDWTGLCISGHSQSPINIDTDHSVCVREGDTYARAHQIEFHYTPQTNLALVHNGHSLQVNGDLGYATVGYCSQNCAANQYKLKQFHFHAPSEHEIDALSGHDSHYSMEMHIVHQKVGATGLNDLVVVGILWQAHADNPHHPFLDSIDWSQLPTVPQKSHKITSNIDLNLLKEAFIGDYFNYRGSLTTPTCDETVNWFVMKNPLTMSKTQLEKIQVVFQKKASFAAGNGNNRIVEPVNSRQVTWFRRDEN